MDVKTEDVRRWVHASDGEPVSMSCSGGSCTVRARGETWTLTQSGGRYLMDGRYVGDAPKRKGKG